MTILDRFPARVTPDPASDCWLWTGFIQPNGYGRAYMDKKMQFAHRIAFSLAKGPIPSKTCVCHRCDNPRCVNPEHLFLGDQAANIGDMIQKHRQNNQKKTQCPAGHEYTPENVYLYQGRRYCRACTRTRNSKRGA